MVEADDEEDYYVPLEDQRVFGAGIKRKRIAFVPQTSSSSSSDNASFDSIKKPSDVGDRYLSIVLPHKRPASNPRVNSDDQSRPSADSPAPSPPTVTTDPAKICPICNLPLSTPVPSSAPHESSIPHQASLPHSHPPSHLPRENIGLKYLSSYGWDPDSRLGLGTTGTGIRVPIKAKEKNDTVGLGINLSKQKKEQHDEPIRKLNAKEVRRLEEAGKRRGERLRKAFYQRDDVAKYLGENG